MNYYVFDLHSQCDFFSGCKLVSCCKCLPPAYVVQREVMFSQVSVNRGGGLPTLDGGTYFGQEVPFLHGGGGYLAWVGGNYLGLGYLPWTGVPTLDWGGGGVTYLGGVEVEVLFVKFAIGNSCSITRSDYIFLMA